MHELAIFDGVAEDEIKELVEANMSFSKQPLLYVQDENSQLIMYVKPANQHLFDALFNKRLFEIIDGLGLGCIPHHAQYLSFLNSQMCFCKNVSERFLKIVGKEKAFRVTDGKICEYEPKSLKNLLYLAITPVELASFAWGKSLAAFTINHRLEHLRQKQKEADAFWRENNREDFSPELIKKAYDGALDILSYSIYSSLARTHGIRLKKCKMTTTIISQYTGSTISYTSPNPYDLSKPSLSEHGSDKPDLIIESETDPYYVLRQNAKHLASAYLAVIRYQYLRYSEKKSLGDDVFFLFPDELEEKADEKNLRPLIDARKQRFEKDKGASLPQRFIIDDKKILFEENITKKTTKITGVSTGAKRSVKGRVIFVDPESNPKNIGVGDVIASYGFSPELVVYYNKCSAIISKTGGKLAHSAIVAREKDLPCIIQVEDLESLKEGDYVVVDGKTGTITKS